jgi:hypothetical protein
MDKRQATVTDIVTDITYAREFRKTPVRDTFSETGTLG